MNRNRPSYRLGPGAAVNNNNGTVAAAAGGGHRRTVSSSSGVGRLTPVSLASKPVPPPASMQPRGSIVRQNNFTEEMAQSSHVLGGTSFGRPPTLPPTASSTTAAAAGKRRSKKKDDINTTPTTTTTTTTSNNNNNNTTVSNGAAADETTPRIAKKSKKSTVGSPGLAKLPAGGGGGTTRGSPIMKAGASSPRGNTLSQAKRSTTTTKRISGSTDALPSSNGNGKMNNNNNNGNSAGSNGRSMLDELPSRPFSDRGSQRPLPLESRPEAAEPEKPLTAPSMLHQQQTDLNLPRLRKGSTAASSPKMAGRRRLPSILVSTGGGVPHPLNTEADGIAPASSVAAIPLRTRTASLSGGLESCGAHSEGTTPQSHRGVTPRSGAQRGSLNPIQGVSPAVSSRATSVSPAASAGTGALMGQRRPSFGSAAFSTQSRSNSATPNLMQYPTSCATSARSSVSGWSGASSAAEESEADDDDDSTDDDDEEDDDDVTAQDEESSDDSDDSSEESEEESESDDESDGGAHRHHRRRRGSRRADDKMLVTKVSREGDLNMKVLTINQRTKFRHYVKDVMKRFGYKQPTDFDMYCIDPSGDRVDVDIEEDFKDLTHRFWSRQKEMRAAQHKKHHGGDAQAAAAAAARGRLGGGGDSARHTVDERSSDTFIRLYVRDSYTYRMSKIPPVNTSTPVSTSSPNQNTVNTLLISTTKSYGSSPSDAHAFDSPSNMALQFAETQRNQLLSTISFKETEEVQWTRMSVLGRGSFGTVYEGITADGKIMAVKVQEIPLNEDSEETKALQMEINLMRSLKHKNIVAYYGCQTRDLSDTSKQMEIFLELCHGGSLAHLRKKFDKAHEPFTISLVRSYTRQILEGLSYLHSRNVMHRDIKSDNVLISAMGEAKLADFGCSKRIGTTTLAADQKAGGAYQTMVGSPIFMAPEVMKGDCGYSMPADVWSVGCLVLELLGRDPWKLDTGNVFQVMFRISQSKGMPTGVPSKCPPTLLDFFEKCFERDPDKRATAAQLLKHKWITCSDSSLEAVPPEDDAPTAAAASA